MEDEATKPNKRSLLVIDDDVEWTDLLSAFFSNKYDVSVANHAEEAIEAIGRQAPAVIILDLIMPSVDGFGLMHRMRETLLVDVPTVLTTGWVSVDVRECAESVGCVAVLSKPVSLVELEALVSSIMDGTHLGFNDGFKNGFNDGVRKGGSQLEPESV